MKNVLIIGALAASTVMYGAVLVPTGSPTWQPVTTTPVFLDAGTGNETITASKTATGGNAYWNNESSDNQSGPGSGSWAPGLANNQCANIGCYITGTGAFTGYAYTPDTPPLPLTGNPRYLTSSSVTGAAITDFAFDNTSVGNTGPIKLLAEITFFNPNDWLGWYETGYAAAGTFSAADQAANKWGVIFTGGHTPGATVAANFSPAATFGLWFLNDVNSPATLATVGSKINASGVFSESSFNRANPNNVDGDTAGQQHFAVFAQDGYNNTLPADYWIGVEDVRLAGGLASGHDKDYQDMVIHMKVVPEPGYYVLLSLGLAALGLRRRMNKTSVN